jgi:hypothetical protein
VDGRVKQDSDISKLIWPVPNIISIASHWIELKPGDLNALVAEIERSGVARCHDWL